MGGYWWKVCKRAFREAAELVGFGSAERAVVTIALQGAIAFLIYLLLGETELHDNTGVRLATALAPLAVFPLLFLWKLVAVPAAIYQKQRLDEDAVRHGHIFYLSDLYVREELPENADLIRRYLAYPPAEWLNAKLEELGFDWRVEIHPGAKYTTHDVD